MATVRLAPRNSNCEPGAHFTGFCGLPRLVSVFGRITSVRATSVLGLPMPRTRCGGVTIGPSSVRDRVIGSLSIHTRGIHGNNISDDRSGVLLVAGSNEGLTLSREVVSPLLPSFRNDGIGTLISGMCRV